MKPSVGVIHEATEIALRSPQRDFSQDITPTYGFSDRKFDESYLEPAMPKFR